MSTKCVILAFALMWIPVYAVAGGTGQNVPPAESADAIQTISCPEPRPEICTQDYRPVCAQMQDGSVKTYSNGCGACSDPAVVGYSDGECQ